MLDGRIFMLWSSAITILAQYLLRGKKSGKTGKVWKVVALFSQV